MSDVVIFELNNRNKPHWGHGHHHFDAALHCGVMKALRSLWPDDDASKGIGTGTLFHAFMELHYRGLDFAPDEVNFIGSYNEEHRIEAVRLAEWYIPRFPNYELGRTVGTEMWLPEPPEAFAKPNKAQLVLRKRVLDAFGIEYCAILDTVHKLNKRDLQRIKHTRGITLEEPGIYLCDHKTEARDGFQDRLLNSRQFTGAMALWNLCRPAEPCRGMLVNVVVKTKEIWNALLFIPPPEAADIEALKYRLSIGKEFLERLYMNDANCFPYIGRPCDQILNGQCDRTPHTIKRVEAELTRRRKTFLQVVKESENG